MSGGVPRILVFVALSCGLVSCADRRRASDAGSPTTSGDGGDAAVLEHDALRDECRLILERHCGRCHIRDYATALPGALAVFEERGRFQRFVDAELARRVRLDGGSAR